MTIFYRLIKTNIINNNKTYNSYFIVMVFMLMLIASTTCMWLLHGRSMVLFFVLFNNLFFLIWRFRWICLSKVILESARFKFNHTYNKEFYMFNFNFHIWKEYLFLAQMFLCLDKINLFTLDLLCRWKCLFTEDEALPQTDTVVPERSYSSSEDEDFYDAEDFKSASSTPQ